MVIRSKPAIIRTKRILYDEADNAISEQYSFDLADVKSIRTDTEYLYNFENIPRCVIVTPWEEATIVADFNELYSLWHKSKESKHLITFLTDN